MTAITSAFRAIRKEAGLPTFRIYDCRVQAITKLLSNPMVSPQVSREIAGHISQAMQDRYSIQQFDTKMAALEALDIPRFPPKKPVEKISEIPVDAVGHHSLHYGNGKEVQPGRRDWDAEDSARRAYKQRAR